jgi:chemotaxis regulatin CheY-phosphate phosphatase CheZ
MRLGGLPEQIETLVTHLRKREDNPPSLTEVAAVTEILIRTMESFFRSVDIKIYQECQNLSDYISNARKEIAALEPENPDNARIPRAGKELDAIVRATEEATNTIMEAAEEIMSADISEIDAYQQTVNEAVMRIFEACSFQDITGQRISKVVETLTYIEQRAKDLRALMDVTGIHHHAAVEEKSEDEKLLNGPALEGEGIDQSEVDALLNGEAKSAPAPLAEKAPAAAKPSAPAKPAPVAKKPAAEKNGVKAAAALKPVMVKVEKVEKVEKIDELPASESGHTTQDDIDALFG